MPIQRMEEIRGMPADERRRRIAEFRTKLVRMRTMVEAGGAVDNPARIRELKKAIARILTVMNEEARRSGEGHTVDTSA